MGARSKILAQCQPTTVQSPLLWDLLCGDARKHIPGAINLLRNGHTRIDPARQVLSYIIRRALGIVRLPGTYDLKMRQSFFDHLDPDALEEAVVDAKRIYDHTQSELQRVWANPTIDLVRGTRNEESAAIRFLIDKLEGETVPFYLSTLTFFNHISGSFTGDFTVSFDCPVEWVWASEYTLSMLGDRNGCEEFIVASTAPTGMVELPKSAFKSTPTCSPHEHIRVTGFRNGCDDRQLIGHAIASLVHEGLEPDTQLRYALEYSPGKWESRMRKWAESLLAVGKRLDGKAKNGQPTIRRELRL